MSLEVRANEIIKFVKAGAAPSDIVTLLSVAVLEAVIDEREKCIDAAFSWWCETEDLDCIPMDEASKGIRDYLVRKPSKGTPPPDLASKSTVEAVAVTPVSPEIQDQLPPLPKSIITFDRLNEIAPSLAAKIKAEGNEDNFFAYTGKEIVVLDKDEVYSKLLDAQREVMSHHPGQQLVGMVNLKEPLQIVNAEMPHGSDKV